MMLANRVFRPSFIHRRELFLAHPNAEAVGAADEVVTAGCRFDEMLAELASINIEAGDASDDEEAGDDGIDIFSQRIGSLALWVSSLEASGHSRRRVAEFLEVEFCSERQAFF